MIVLEEKWPRSLAAYRDILTRCLRAFDRTLPVERVILFGSHAQGQARDDSDVDLCVVVDGIQSQHQAAIALRQAIGGLRGKPPLTLIPISIERMREKRQSRDPFFATVLADGICLAHREGLPP